MSMDKQKLNISLSRFHFSFRRVGEGSVDSNTMWRVYLSFMFGGVVAVALTAYLSYLWAMNDDASMVPLVSSRDTQTVAELKGVVAVYRQKEHVYEELLITAPTAPSYERGRGVDVPALFDGVEEMSDTDLLIEVATTSPEDASSTIETLKVVN